jgi:hypothetical protein
MQTMSTLAQVSSSIMLVIADHNKINFIGVLGKNTPIKLILL